MTDELTCGSCYGPMQIVTVHHANRRATEHRICPTCLTTRAAGDVYVDEDTVKQRRHLTVVR